MSRRNVGKLRYIRTGKRVDSGGGNGGGEKCARETVARPVLFGARYESWRVLLKTQSRCPTSQRASRSASAALFTSPRVRSSIHVCTALLHSGCRSFRSRAVVLGAVGCRDLRASEHTREHLLSRELVPKHAKICSAVRQRQN